MSRSSNAYALALRHAEETRSLVRRLGMLPKEPSRRCRRQGGIPGSPKSARSQPRKGEGIGKRAYEWALRNKATAIEAGRRFKCGTSVIYAHRSRYNLPQLPR